MLRDSYSRPLVEKSILKCMASQCASVDFAEGILEFKNIKD